MLKKIKEFWVNKVKPVLTKVKNGFNEFMRIVRNLLRYHGVKLIMLVLTAGVFSWDAVKGTNYGSPFLLLLILFQARGIHWEEMYRLNLVKVNEQLAKLKQGTNGAKKK